MTFEYIDIHSHLHFPEFDDDREEVIKKMKHEKIAAITIGTDLGTSKQCVELAEKHSNIFACVGQHPGSLTVDSVFEEKLVKLSDNPRVVAIGECGLDYFGLSQDDEDIKRIQKTIFEYHIDLALSKDLPLMLHIRGTKRGDQDAYCDALVILEHHYKLSGGKLRGNAHFFAGDMAVLNRFLAIGFTLSFNGVITFTKDYDGFVRFPQLDMIMSETDCPLLAPVPHRGKRNSSLYVPEVVKKIAEIRNESETGVKIALIHNALKQFPVIKRSIAR